MQGATGSSLCVCGASGDIVNMDSDLGACYIDNCDMFISCMHIIFQNKTVLLNVCEKRVSQQYIYHESILVDKHMPVQNARQNIHSNSVKSGW